MENLSLTFENMGVKLPYSMEAEQAVLGAALLQNDCIPMLVEKLRPEHFYARQNGAIFAELVRLFTGGAAIDFVTVLSAVMDAGVFSTEDEAKVYLATLAETVPSISNVERYAGIVYEKYLIRQLMGAAREILEQARRSRTPTSCSRARSRRSTRSARAGTRAAMQPISSTIIDTYNQLQKISGPDRDKYLGIPTGFTYLDKMLTGMGRSDLIILAARPGMGKTSFALNIATNVAKKQKIPVAIFSLEMTKDQLTSRSALERGGHRQPETAHRHPVGTGLGGSGTGQRYSRPRADLYGRHLRHHGAGDQGEGAPAQSGPRKAGCRPGGHRLSAADELRHAGSTPGCRRSAISPGTSRSWPRNSMSRSSACPSCPETPSAAPTGTIGRCSPTCGIPARSSRMPTACCSSTGRPIMTPRGRAIPPPPSALWQRTVTVRSAPSIWAGTAPTPGL